ncbi:unnamed protein product [Owenia fusiformis]|uniref:Large ribosomal subunit protein mL46 n=1 Tax=Owenia fusiformis TaxID=6347 RepID=A0A8J1T4Q8_OWEFU|nr:unnamed protein product [Owenia fusiformis]
MSAPILRKKFTKYLINCQYSAIKRESLKIIQRPCPLLYSTTATEKPKWQLVSAVCLERLPIVSAKLNEIEAKFANLQETLEYEYSSLSEFEVRHKKEQALAAKKAKEQEHGIETGETVVQTAQDIEDLWERELKEFDPATREDSNDVKSVERDLDKKLLLVVKQKLGNKEHWVLPQIPWTEGETMRQSAERCLGSSCGSEINARFIGNAPSGVYKYNLPKDLNQDHDGVKVFFFKAHHVTGDVKPGKDTISEHMWLSKDELKDYMHPDYHRTISRFIMD